MESNLNEVEQLVRSVLREVAPPDGVWSSHRLCRELGRRLEERDEGPGILRSAYRQNVPVFIPAFTDSEVGLDVATWAMKTALGERDPSQLKADEVFSAVPPFNPFVDLLQYARQTAQSERLGIFTIGGGVPRNWAQQVAPFFDIVNHRVGTQLQVPRFRYGVRICPEPIHWGGLSGCTYSEGVSWGKFVPPAEGGRFAEVFADATLVWPLLIKALFEELDREH
jgi:deoxyhypusine synthase